MAKPKRIVVSSTKRGPTEVDRTIGSRLKARRLEMGISQDELGKKLGLSFQQVQKYEKGLNRIGPGRLVDAAKILNVDAAFFLGDMTNGRASNGSRFAEFLATRDGVAINDAMMELGDAHRREVIALARTLGRAYPRFGKKPRAEAEA